MKTEDFIKLLLGRGYKLDRKTSCDNVTFEYLWKLSPLTEYIDYDCSFNGRGCKCNKNSIKCCCGGCYTSIGHFQEHYPNNYKVLEIMAKNFDYENKNGFWNKDKGCTLPRKYRSVTCLTYNCNRNLKSWERLLLSAIKGKYLNFFTYSDYNGSIIYERILSLKEKEESGKEVFIV